MAYLDGPGGTGVPAEVIEAMAGRLRVGTSNIGGAFGASREADSVVAAAREAVADLLGGRPEEVAFGQNMTSLTFAVSRALARSWGPGDEVVVTRLDHDANVAPWRLAAADRGAAVRLVEFDPADGTLDLAHLERVLGPHTRLLAVTAASNALGTVPPGAAGRRPGACRRGPGLRRCGALRPAPPGGRRRPWGRLPRLLGLQVLRAPHRGAVGAGGVAGGPGGHKVVPAPDSGPGKWETGTQSFESLAGVAAAVDYLASLGAGGIRRERLAAAYAAIREHEEVLARRFLAGEAALSHVRLYGLAEPTRLGERTATFALEVAGLSPEEASRRLGEQGLHTWSGDYYAVGVMEHLGVASRGGLLRIGFVHYNTAEEVDRVLEALADLKG